MGVVWSAATAMRDDHIGDLQQVLPAKLARVGAAQLAIRMTKDDDSSHATRTPRVAMLLLAQKIAIVAMRLGVVGIVHHGVADGRATALAQVPVDDGRGAG